MDLTVCVLGAGTMGRGIAHACLVAGHAVRLQDVDEEVLADAVDRIDDLLAGGVDRGMLTGTEADAARDRLETTTDAATAADGVDLAIEAVPEREDLKRDVLAGVEEHAGDAVIATNTSSIPVTGLASALSAPSRCVGLHFFNPVYALDLVEVVLADQTDDETRAFAESFVRGIDKEPVVVRDAPGFATSRLGVALGLEAIRMVESGVASPEAIDRGMTLGYDHPTGPLELTDRVGLDVRLDVATTLREELGERFRPPALLRRKVRADNLGQKTGEGFYVWEDGEPVAVAPEFRAANGEVDR